MNTAGGATQVTSARRLAIDRAQLGVADQAVDIVYYAFNGL